MTNLSQVVSRDEWLVARTELLATKKEATRARDALNEQRRRLPMVRDEGCPSCSLLVDNIGHLPHLHARNTSLAVVSRAPLAKIEPFKQRMGWTVPWFSAYGSDFNYDFHVTTDAAVAPAEYNYGPVRRRVDRARAPSCATGTRSSTPTPATPAAATSSLAPTTTSTSPRWAGRKTGSSPGRSDGSFMSWMRRHDEYDAE